MNFQHIQRIVTHDGQFHADEIFAVASLSILGCKAPCHRTRDYREIARSLGDPSVMVLDVGGVFEPNRLNFDHHQNPNLPATNILILDTFKPWWGQWVKTSLFSYISDVDRGIIGDGGESYAINRIIRNLNLVPSGFVEAIKTAITILGGYIAVAEKIQGLRRVWNSLERTPSGKVVVIPNYEQTEGWKICAKPKELILASPWRGKGWQLEVKDSSLVIPRHESQTFLHASGFCATYPNKAVALEHAEAIVRAV